MWRNGSRATGTATWPNDEPRRHQGMAKGDDLPEPAPPASSPRSQRARSPFGWRTIVLVLLIVFLAYQVVVPFVMIIWTSLKTARPGEAEFLEFSFTLANYIRAFDSPSFWRTTTNTLAF